MTTETDLQEIYDFLVARHAEEADTIQMRTITFARNQVLAMANSELEMIDENEIIERCFDVLKAQTQPYSSHDDYRHEWSLDLMP